MDEIYTEIEIDASPGEIWKLLTDFSRYGQWNPFIRSIKGDLKEGSTFNVFIKPPGTSGMLFKPTVTRVDNNKELRWLGHLIMPGIFDGEHVFHIDSIPGSRVKFIQRERFKGILKSIILKRMANNTRRGFEKMNRALKARA